MTTSVGVTSGARPDAPTGRRVRIVGPGRAGGAFATVLAGLGWVIAEPVGRGGTVRGAAHGVDLVMITTPDRAVAEVAAAIEPDDALVVHTAGALGLEVLAGHPRRGALHPLVSLPDPVTGAARLRAGAWFAVAASGAADAALLHDLVDSLGGRHFEVADADRAAYHAAAAIASNHLVALVGQVERVAGDVGVPRAAFVALAATTLDGLGGRDAAAVLTGPVARADWDTVAAHLRAIDPAERPAYAAMAEAATRLVPGAVPPAWLVAVRRGDDGAMQRIPGAS